MVFEEYPSSRAEDELIREDCQENQFRSVYIKKYI